jgi:hypothetical protein
MASWIRAAGLVCVSAVIAVGCGDGGGGGAQDLRDEEFAALKEKKTALEAKRQEAADLRDRIAAALAATGEEGAAAGEASVEELQANLGQVESAIEAQSEEFMTALVGFLNTAGMVQGEAPTGTTLEAIRLKSAEDMIIAREYISEGGDYRRAMDILDTALVLDPDNPELQAARADAEEKQFMTAERFAAVTKGMTKAEVQALLGTVHRSNVREYPEKNVVAWFYRRADKGAAGVYFEDKGGKVSVYRADFDAVKPSGDETSLDDGS